MRRERLQNSLVGCLVQLTVQTHDSDTIRFHRFEWACCSVWKYHFQTVRDDTKQSDWPLPGKNRSSFAYDSTFSNFYRSRRPKRWSTSQWIGSRLKEWFFNIASLITVSWGLTLTTRC